MKDGVIASLLQYQTYHLCTLWKIERTDGVVYRLTDHDQSVERPGDGTYSPMDGIVSSAVQSPGGLRDRNQEFRGAISSSVITETDLRAGRYRNAKVTQQTVDHRYPWAEPIRTSVYWITETQWNGELWTGEAEGLTSKLKQRVGSAYMRTCRWRLGDENCGVDLDSLAETGLVASVSSARRTFIVTGLSGDPSEYYNNGIVEWQSGANSGLKGEVRNYDNSNGQITLQLKMPFDIEINDSVKIFPGCNLTTNNCINKFNNIENFGGFPFVVGTDRILQTPDAK